MRKIVFLAIIMLAAQVQAQNIFNPLKGVGFLGLKAAGVPAPQQRGSASTTAVVVGTALGGLLGANSQKTAEGAAIGGALGLLIGQMLDRTAQKKAEAQRQASLENPLPKGPEIGAAPQIDPATGLPISDPGQLGPRSTTSKPQLSPRKRVNKLFGR